MSDTAESAEFVELQAVTKGRYILMRELGRGGMGIVYLAHDVALDRAVAIKLLFPHLAMRAGFRERFLAEARTAAKLSHPNIVTVHAVEEHAEMVFFVMAYVSGETLGRRIRQAGRLRVSEAVSFLRETAWALGYAHGNGVIHRDVKPDNILIDRATGRALLADFGIAAARESVADAPGEVLGTPHYMSPEQALGETVDGRSDLYSLGVVGFYALSGVLPFQATNPMALLRQHIEETAPRLATLVPKVPTALAQVVERCLAKQRGDRPASGEEIAETLGASSAIVPETAPEVRLFLRRTGLIGNIAIGLAMLAVLYVWMMARHLSISVSTDGRAAGMLIYLAILAVANLGWFVFAPARRLRVAGFEWKDVKAAIRDDERREAEERAALDVVDVNLNTDEWPAFRSGARRAAAARDVRRRQGRYSVLAIGVAAIAVSVASGLADAAVARVTGAPRILDRTGMLAAEIFAVALVVLFFGGVLALIAAFKHPGIRANAGEIVPLMVQLPYRSWLSNVREWLGEFAAPIRERIVRLAGLGLSPSRRTSSVFAPQTTEFALGSAVDDAFRQLPDDARHRFADVPRVVERLRETAARIRSRGGSDARAVNRLATVTAAMDDLRLMIVKLRVSAITEGDLTATIRKVDEIGRRVDAELEVQAALRAP